MSEKKHTHHTIDYLEFCVTNMESSKKFFTDAFEWQFTDYGSIECGPKARLNENSRVELYDVSDLLYLVPDFDNAPEFDLQSAIQQGGQGGGNPGKQ